MFSSGRIGISRTTSIAGSEIAKMWISVEIVRAVK
jgi:hypothetical protein